MSVQSDRRSDASSIVLQELQLGLESCQTVKYNMIYSYDKNRILTPIFGFITPLLIFLYIKVIRLNCISLKMQYSPHLKTTFCRIRSNPWDITNENAR